MKENLIDGTIFSPGFKEHLKSRLFVYINSTKFI